MYHAHHDEMSQMGMIGLIVVHPRNRMALAEMRRARKLYTDTAVRVRARAQGTVARLRATGESARYYQAVLLPRRQHIVDNTQLEYNAMEVGVFQLLQAKREQIAAAAGYVDLLREYWTLRDESGPARRRASTAFPAGGCGGGAAA
ncbi:MAG: hypothetical protein ABI488_15020 [Polyangiaceae bacterium]